MSFIARRLSSKKSKSGDTLGSPRGGAPAPAPAVESIPEVSKETSAPTPTAAPAAAPAADEGSALPGVAAMSEAEAAAAATKVQSVYRSAAAKKTKEQLAAEKEQQEAATKVQAAMRGQAVRKGQGSTNAAEEVRPTEGTKAKESAAVKVQSGFRGLFGRKAKTKKTQEKAETASAATKEKAETEAAVTKVQSGLRGFTARKQVASQLATEKAATAVQAVSRRKLARARTEVALVLKAKAQEVEGGVERLASKGQLQVHVLRASNLMAKDRSGFSDPFVSFTLDGRQFKTSICKADLNPEWNESFTVMGNLGSLIDQKILFKVYDHDRLTANDFLGEISVFLDELLTEDEVTITDQPLLGATTGSISLHFVWRSEVDLAHERAVAELTESAKAETISSLYLNIVMLNTKEVMLDKLRDEFTSRLGKAGASLVSKTVGGVKAEQMVTLMAGKIAESICQDLVKKLWDTGLIVSAEHVLSISAGADGVQLVVICVRFHKVDLQVLLRDKCSSQALCLLKCLGMEARVSRSVVRRLTPEIAGSLGDQIESKLLESVRLRCVCSSRLPEQQWTTFQHTVAVHGLPGATKHSHVDPKDIVGAGLPEFLVAKSITNKAFVQRIGVGSKPSKSEPPPAYPSGSDPCSLLDKLAVGVLTAGRPVFSICSRRDDRAREALLARTGGILRIFPLRADSLHNPRAAAAAAAAAAAGAPPTAPSTPMSPSLSLTLIMRGCESPHGPGPDPFRAKTAPAYGKGHTFDFPNAEAAVALPGVQPRHTHAAEAAQAALLVEVWDAPVLSCGDGPMLIGSAVLRLDKLVARAAKARSSSVEMQTSLSLCRADELNLDKAKPSAGTLKLDLVLDKPHDEHTHTHAHAHEHEPQTQPDDEEEEM